MIDDKEKEEAARRNADKYGDCPTLSDEDRDKVSIGSFKDGANWAINKFLKDLWHDPFKEHISCDKKAIVEYTYKGGTHYKSIKIPDDIQWIRGFSNERRLRRWLYVDDLFSKEGDENERA